jgi:hypothetical protein
MATAQQALTPEMAAGFCQVMLDGVTGELEITKRVLAAILMTKLNTAPIPMRAVRGNWRGIWPTLTFNF